MDIFTEQANERKIDKFVQKSKFVKKNNIIGITCVLLSAHIMLLFCLLLIFDDNYNSLNGFFVNNLNILCIFLILFEGISVTTFIILLVKNNKYLKNDYYPFLTEYTSQASSLDIKLVSDDDFKKMLIDMKQMIKSDSLATKNFQVNKNYLAIGSRYSSSGQYGQTIFQGGCYVLSIENEYNFNISNCNSGIKNLKKEETKGNIRLSSFKDFSYINPTFAYELFSKFEEILSNKLSISFINNMVYISYNNDKKFTQKFCNIFSVTKEKIIKDYETLKQAIEIKNKLIQIINEYIKKV